MVFPSALSEPLFTLGGQAWVKMDRKRSFRVPRARLLSSLLDSRVQRAILNELAGSYNEALIYVINTIGLNRLHVFLNRDL